MNRPQYIIENWKLAAVLLPVAIAIWMLATWMS